MPMKRGFLLLFMLLFISVSFAQDKQVKRPKLVVGIVVDQMRWDYLYRYYDRYSEGGFKRLMNEGFNCQNTLINYLPSFTAPGHTCAYTGSVPSIHGIAGNDWLDNISGKYWYCTEDTAVKSIGGSDAAGKMSPRNLLASTVTDELRLATNMHSKVFGVALKDRASILPAGHLANGSFWFDDATGNFITSTFYSNALPQWVVNFNGKRYADSFIKKQWNLLYPAHTYTQSIADNNNYETPFSGETAPVFPHTISSSKNTNYYGLRYLPGGNTIVVKLAEACIKAEQLGQTGNTDFLCVSFSTPDYLGHRFAPNSVEVEDIYLRLDKELANLLNYLDRHVGEGDYTVFLTADHGAAHNPQYLRDIKMYAGITSDKAMASELNAYLGKKFKAGALVDTIINYQVYLREDLITKTGVNRNDVKTAITTWLEKQDGVDYAIDLEFIGRIALPEPIREMVVNGYNRKRSGCIQLIPEPGWYSSDYGLKGTTHGTWNPYDTHIPLLWYGWGIPAGETFKPVHMTDIAATVAALLHIQMPNGCIGKPIPQIVK